MIYTKYRPVYFFLLLNQNSMQIQKKCHFWSRITSKNDKKWLIGEMTLKSEGFIHNFYRIFLLFDLISYALCMIYLILSIYLIESSHIKRKYLIFIHNYFFYLK